MKNKILGASLEYKAKILILNICIGLILVTLTMLFSLFGLKYDYDSHFINQEQKLKDLIVIQNIYSDLLTKLLREQDPQKELQLLKQAWSEFNAINEKTNLFTHFKDFYAKVFLSHHKELEELKNSEAQIKQIIGERFDDTSILAQEEILANLNTLIHKTIQLHIQILNLKKQATDSLFLFSSSLLIVIACIIILITLVFAQMILVSIKNIHHSLKLIVSDKTKQLRQINDDLQKTIKKEVADSKRKDQIMHQQARLASIGEMIQNIAHQWRQPLNTLVLIIQSFKSKADNDKLTREFIDTQTKDALRIAHNMSETIEDFRNFFQPSTTKTHFSFANSLQSAFNIAKAHLQHQNIGIQTAIPQDFSIFGYENAFTQVLLILINNAKDAILSHQIPKGIIELQVSTEEQYYCIQIKDNGGGIQFQDKERIFEPYVTTKHKSVGTGVGLYMAKQILECQMDGKIFVENIHWCNRITQEEYFGAMFSIKLPMTIISPKES
ncbi:hypothetical protein BBW65_06655 [Helicobacter enhydrae]|uniref:histidine kinase n=1 Tax=Helicobacter enhydrae TaxID=222136 RepID=A0A1B1U7X6_9HELI|nr:hypothetical protein BBW65_06655 [Helicobacter enhydrae]